MKRNTTLWVILSILSCGVLYIYWFYKVNNESNYIANTKFQTNGAAVIILTFISYGIYSFYWAYRKAIHYEILMNKKISISFFTILNIFTLGISSIVLLQNSINYQLELN